MKIILFGGSGFIGKNVMKKFPKNSIVPISLRTYEWKNNLPSEAEVFINLIGKISLTVSLFPISPRPKRFPLEKNETW